MISSLLILKVKLSVTLLESSFHFPHFWFISLPGSLIIPLPDEAKAEERKVLSTRFIFGSIVVNLTLSFFSLQSKSFSVSNMDDAATVVKISLAQFHVQVNALLTTAKIICRMGKQYAPRVGGGGGHLTLGTAHSLVSLDLHRLP